MSIGPIGFFNETESKWLILGVKVGEEQRKMREILLVTDEIYADYGPSAVLLFGFRLA